MSPFSLLILGLPSVFLVLQGCSKESKKSGNVVSESALLAFLKDEPKARLIKMAEKDDTGKDVVADGLIKEVVNAVVTKKDKDLSTV